MIQIENARKEDAPIIAPMIMEAMNLECCQWFAGPNHTLEEFEQLMTRLVAMEESQYSYRNTLVENALRTADYNAWHDGVVGDNTYTTASFGMKFTTK